jgi:hypothetical protein
MKLLHHIATYYVNSKQKGQTNDTTYNQESTVVLHIKTQIHYDNYYLITSSTIVL